ncbi:MAG: peptidylprolyl isomerase [Planctomycetes bacterium]|nr:peptidylprolyl isomerase [Planctomycetota bacterium]
MIRSDAVFSIRVSKSFAGLLFLLASLAYVLPGFAADEVKVRHLLVRGKEEAEKALDELVNLGVNRDNFIKVCRKYSKDHPTKGTGGDLGWNTRGKLDKEFAEVAFTQKVGEVSEPIKTQYGWHLIYVEDKRDTSARTQPPDPAGGEKKSPTASPDVLAPNQPPAATPPAHSPPPATTTPLAQPPAAQPPTAAPATPSTPAATTLPTPATPPQTTTPAVQPVKPPLPPKRLKIALEMAQRRLRPTQPGELSVILENVGQETLKIFHPDLIPLGLVVRSDVPPTHPQGKWEAIGDPTSFLIDLKSRASAGGTFYLTDYFKDLPLNGRFWVSWDGQRFLENFDKKFPGKSAAIEEYAKARELLSAAGGTLVKEVKGLPARPAATRMMQELPFAIYDLPLKGKYFARLDVGDFMRRETQQIWFELVTDRQPQGVEQFAGLASEGYYDGLRFFDIQKDTYLRGGCPRGDGTGSPDRFGAFISNAQKIPHEKGTLSLVTRLKPKTNSREAGSIFFICRKNSPEWDEVHVPIGKAVQGEEILDRIEPGKNDFIQQIAIVPAERGPGGAAAPPASAATTAGGPKILTGQGLPKALIKTTKGDLKAELYQEDAPNTVASFIDLTEQGFFNPKPEEKKEPMQFLDKVAGLYIRTGSPDNSESGGPKYRINSELDNNTRKHEKGIMSMCLETDAKTGQPIPDTAGSQFMICLGEVLYWNGMYTPFGKVIEGLEVLDKLEKGDTIQSVTVIEKRGMPYKPQVRNK